MHSQEDKAQITLSQVDLKMDWMIAFGHSPPNEISFLCMYNATVVGLWELGELYTGFQ